MRGRETHVLPRYVLRWITPAYAGKRSRPPPGLRRSRDHPRVCGEENLDGDINLTEVGSPPRMRGRVGVDFVLCGPSRITPAYAGKSGR